MWAGSFSLRLRLGSCGNFPSCRSCEVGGDWDANLKMGTLGMRPTWATTKAGAVQVFRWSVVMAAA